ncbi:GNAT family protein [Actinoallomurus sp. NPDC052274]|uniref:GNAT family N-acetyltransferase n=1 Tax=Actinoallomurus sp. NPDC052274 TaxID=3155420 RepID=UPI00341BA19E
MIGGLVSGSRVTFGGDAMAAVVQGVIEVRTLIGQPPVIVGGLAVLSRLDRLIELRKNPWDAVGRPGRAARPHRAISGPDSATGVMTSTCAERVVAETMTVNAASRRVMEKAGLTLVRTFHPDGLEPIEGSEHGEVEYALSRADWERKRH